MRGRNLRSLGRLCLCGVVNVRRNFSTLGIPHLPKTHSEPMLDYAPRSAERAALKKSLADNKATHVEIPCMVGGKEYFTGNTRTQVMPSNHGHVVCTYHVADAELIRKSIESTLQCKAQWENMPFEERASIFLKAADLLASVYRYDQNAKVMLGTGKNVWQAEIDAAAECIDFWRFGAAFAQEVYNLQPTVHSTRIWNRLEHRPLEGYVVAITPFNFSAIGANLPSTPAIMGNVVLWKPSSTAVLGNYSIYKILEEAGLPPGVIDFLPSNGKVFGEVVFNHLNFAGLHFTGSTGVFNHCWRTMAQNLAIYKSYPRVVGETGGKNFHFVHKSANVSNVINNTIRGAFEYQGQKCSACSRAYIPSNLWDEVRKGLIDECAKIKIGQPDDFEVFMTAVIDQASFNNAKSYIENARESDDCEIIVGGTYDDSEGFFIHPTIVVTTNPKHKLMQEEIFAPILTIYVYPEDEYVETLKICDDTSVFGLTGSLFASDRYAIQEGSELLRNSAGNFYLNDKSTGAVVGEQPFGGMRSSGTNDKAGSVANYYRWVSPRSVKENFVYCNNWTYPHMNSGD